MAHLKSALGQRNRDEDFRFAVLAINLERFRLVNDSFGHASGDALLRQLADRIRGTLRQGDVAARVGATSSRCSSTASAMPPRPCG